MTEAEKLHQIFEEEWEWTLREFPTMATYVGDPRYGDRLPDLSLEAIDRRREHTRELRKRIQQIDTGQLSSEDQLNHELFLRDVELDLEGQQFRGEFMPINQMGGVHSEIPELARMAPRRTVRQVEEFLSRLEQVPALVGQTIVLMKRGLEMGMTPPRVTLREVANLINAQIVDEPTESPIYEIYFDDLGTSIPAPEQERLKREGARVIGESVVPALRELHRFWVEEYEPRTRESIAMSELPDGLDWYGFNVRLMTTTDLTPDQIHEVGIREVERIRAEMEKVQVETGFEGTLGEFFTFLRTDPRFFFTEKDDLLRAYRDIAKRVDPELPKLFGRLPRLPYGVEPVPEYSEKTQTTAYYYPGSLEAGRPGLFYANTYDLKSRPKWEMEALTVHEAVPGHHLQISLAQELENVPRFRRFGGITAFVEGWGLYSESLGPELGLYRDPYSRFGQLTYEMWRAIRLVVDTGMHAKGWSRDQAIEFFRTHAGKTEHDIIVEIDRYIVWPGQALAYKIGQLEIQKLRDFATRELGEEFDIRQFHDRVLGAGPLPLKVLEKQVTQWIAEKKAGGPASGVATGTPGSSDRSH